MTTLTDQRRRSVSTREDSLFNAIKPGDAEHQAWLKDAIEAHFAGRPVPPASGSGTKDRRIAELQSALATARREALEEADAEIVSELGEFYESGMRRFGGAAEADVQAVLTMAQKAMFTIIAQAIALQTEKTMHAAWRKRAEEAERALLSQSV